MSLQDYEEQMAQDLKQMRASREIGSPFEQSEEQRDLLNQSSATSSSGHAEILPHRDESKDLRVLSPSDNEWVSREDETEGIFKS